MITFRDPEEGNLVYFAEIPEKTPQSCSGCCFFGALSRRCESPCKHKFGSCAGVVYMRVTDPLHANLLEVQTTVNKNKEKED